MSFFAGRLNNKSILSLRRGEGGDTNIHINPDSQTIFHSDMPHVIIVETHSTGLRTDQGAGDYYWTEMPSRVTQLHNNDPNRVVLTEVEFSDGSRHMLSGMSMGVGAKAYGIVDPRVMSQGGLKTQITASADLSLDVGYFYSGTSGTIPQKLRDGTGCQHVFGAFSGRRGFANASMYTGGAALYKSAWTGTGYIYPAAETLTVPSDAIRHPGARNFGFNAIYVRGRSCNRVLYGMEGPNRANAGNMVGASNSANTVVNHNPNNPDITAYTVGFGRADPTAYAYWEGMPDPNDAANGPIGIFSEHLGIYPSKITWYVTNMVYNGSGYSIDYNLFNGSDIKLSPNEFIIKGVNINTTSWKFINFVEKNFNPGSRPDFRDVGCNLSMGSPSTGITGIATFGLPTTESNNAPSIKGGNVGGLNTNVVSIYNFLPSSSWYVSSNPPKIGSNYGDVWSENLLPLRLLGGSGSTILSGQVVFQSTGYVHVGTVGLDMNSSRNGAVVCTMEFIDDTWLSAGGIGCFNPTEMLSKGAEYGDSRFRVGPNTIDKKLHQILSLPVGEYVPFFTIKGTVVNACRVISAAFTPTAFWVPALPGNVGQTGYYTLTYYMRNDGNNNISIWLESSMSNIIGMKACLPNIKLIVQRLT
ncbi:MAG: hypothetical protein EOM35_08860 [Negativicutes bacterium]|nr:hypothetical protein [Negativicutes bacterium]